MPLTFAGFRLTLSGSKIKSGLTNIWFHPFKNLMYQETRLLVLTSYGGSVILNFPHCITHLLIPLSQLNICTQSFLPLEAILGLATVLVQIAGSNTSLAYASPQATPIHIGRFT